MWDAGDYAAVGAKIVPVAERLIDRMDLAGGARVLDIATGTGNAAIAAARGDCEVVGIDFAVGLLRSARARAEGDRFAIEFREADAGALPFKDASFDAVVSVFGVMFAPDQERAAAELLRVCRPGGRIGLAAWTPDGMVGEMFGILARHAHAVARAAPADRLGDPGAARCAPRWRCGPDRGRRARTRLPLSHTRVVRGVPRRQLRARQGDARGPRPGRRVRRSRAISRTWCGAGIDGTTARCRRPARIWRSSPPAPDGVIVDPGRNAGPEVPPPACGAWPGAPPRWARRHDAPPPDPVVWRPG